MKNRIVMSPLTRCRADDDHVPTAMMAEYYASRASMGLIVTESIMVQPDYSAMAYEPGIYSAAQVAAWRTVTDAVHARGGLIAAQIFHGGRATVPCNLTAEGLVPVSASAVPIAAESESCMAEWSRDGVAQPFAQDIHAMSVSEIKWMVEMFACAARNCVAAGFDCVEIHAGTGYLIDQFLKTSSNQRTDEYGGSLENRCRFLLEVVDAVVQKIQPDRVGVRLTPLDSTNGQHDSAPEALLRYVCEELDRRRVAFIDLFRGDPKAAGEVARSDVWARESFGGTILASHGYGDAAAADAAIAEGAVDAVCFGLPAVSNPDLVWRILSGTALNQADLSKLFTRGAEGYIDYPICQPKSFLVPNVVDGGAAAAAAGAEASAERRTVTLPPKERPFYAISQPLLIGPVTMKNRLVMGPMARQRCDENHCPTPMMVDYYARRAGYGLQVSDPCEVQPGYYTYVQGAAISTKAQVEAWRKVTDAVHNAGGLIYCQLHHGGRAVLPCNITSEDKRVVGPTTQGIPPEYTCPAVFAADGQAQPYAQDVTELRPATLEWIVKLFAAAAKNAMVAGFDGVEIHAGGGYLLDQFLRQNSNTRMDDYGASSENRCRLLDKVVDAVVAAVGKYRVAVRVSPTDLSKGMTGIDAEEVARVVGTHLCEKRLAYIVLSSGSDGYFHGPVPTRVIQALRASYTGVVMCDDNVSMAEAELRVKEDAVQAVCMTLGAIANPDIIDRAIHGVAVDEPDLHTLSTHGAEGYDTYTPYAELRRQLREEQSREWAEKDAEYATEGHDWLPEQRASVLRKERQAMPASQQDQQQQDTPAVGGARVMSSSPFTSMQRDRRGSIASSSGYFRSSSLHNMEGKNIRSRNGFNSSENTADADTPNAAAANRATSLQKPEPEQQPSWGPYLTFGTLQRQCDRSVSNGADIDAAGQPAATPHDGVSIFIRRDSRASRRQSIA
jgi:N-ethylmaleimide reductase